MGIEHERVHLETSSVLIRQQDLARVRPRPERGPVEETGEAPTDELIRVPAGAIRIGEHEAKAFCEWKGEQTGHPIRMPTEDEWYRLCSAAGIEEVGNNAANADLPFRQLQGSSVI